MVVGDRRTGLSMSQTADLLGFSHTPSLGFTENGSGKRENIQRAASCVDEHVLLISEDRGEWTDWLEMIERQQ